YFEITIESWPIRRQASAASWSEGQRERRIWMKRPEARSGRATLQTQVFGDNSLPARTVSERTIDVARRRVAGKPRADDRADQPLFSFSEPRTGTCRRTCPAFRPRMRASDRGRG